MDGLHRAGELAAADIQKALPDPPGYSAVRAMLRTLEDKGHIKHREQDLRYVYAPGRLSGASTAIGGVTPT